MNAWSGSSGDPSPAGRHPPQLTVNGRNYRWPSTPVVVLLVDGADPDYLAAALDHKAAPNLERLMREGWSTIALGAMPSLTNTNNMSVITGVPPSVHGITGNYFLDPATGRETMMDQPALLRADSILGQFSRHGATVVAISAKNKLSRLLRHQVQDGLVFSAEDADRCTLEENGITGCLAYVGLPLPHIYSVELSLFVLEAGVKLFRERRPDLMYLTLTDNMQHQHAPGSQATDDLYRAIDDAVGRLVAAGAIVGLTGDHGMHDKCTPTGEAKVIYLQDVLDAAFGAGTTQVILPITDPYVAHHAALGSYATVFLRSATPVHQAVRAISALPGVELVLTRDAAALSLELPPDRIGDLVVIGDQGTVLGTRQAGNFLAQLGGRRLRSHGGLADRKVSFILSRPLDEVYAAIPVARQVRNFDIFDFALNGVR